MKEITKDPYQKKWKMVILMFIIECIQFLGYSGYSTQSEQIMHDLSLDYTQFSMLASSCTLAIGICILFVGILCDYWSPKKLTTIGLLIMAISQFLFSIADSYPTVILARIIAGIGISAVVSAPYSLSEKWFSKSKSASLSYAIMLSADGIGGLLALYGFAIIVALTGWRMGGVISGVAYIVLFIISLLFLKDHPDHDADVAAIRESDPKPFHGFIKILFNKNVLGASAIVVGHTGAYAIATFWIPTILQEEAGFSTSVSGFLANLYPIVAIPFMIAMPIFTANLKRQKPLMLILGCASAAIFFLCAAAVKNHAFILLAVLLTILGIVNYMNSSLAFSQASSSVGTNKAGIATAIVQFFAFTVGGAVFPSLIGIARDKTNSYEMGFIIMAFCLIFLMIIMPLMIKENTNNN